MKLAIILALVAFQVAGAPPAKSTRTVSGVVTDRLGNTLRGAVVEIENTRSLAVASYITENDGKYYFHQLSTDVDYTLRARYRTIWSKSKLLNKFNGAAEADIDLEIPTK